MKRTGLLRKLAKPSRFLATLDMSASFGCVRAEPPEDTPPTPTGSRLRNRARTGSSKPSEA
ncbi:protein of unknown function [Methylococcus capsulatus]|uniref:Uncharacterized protein n=1 Tax=Methylococcus capsulatus TaxID=414 RepID=A0AA35V5V5_METCP|nr:protein of unknown function [Methylococcus capsulatus]